MAWAAHAALRHCGLAFQREIGQWDTETSSRIILGTAHLGGLFQISGCFLQRNRSKGFFCPPPDPGGHLPDPHGALRVQTLPFAPLFSGYLHRAPQRKNRRGGTAMNKTTRRHVFFPLKFHCWRPAVTAHFTHSTSNPEDWTLEISFGILHLLENFGL